MQNGNAFRIDYKDFTKQKEKPNTGPGQEKGQGGLQAGPGGGAFGGPVDSCEAAGRYTAVV